MKNRSLLILMAIVIIAMNSLSQVTGKMTDARDGKVYKTVTIGTQTWMAENLAYKAKSGCWAYNDSVSYVATYGYLYNWETAKTACPTAWHLPSDAEWTTLTTTVGGEDVAGDKLKSPSHRLNSYKAPTNSSGFTALPGGNRFSNGTYHYIKYTGYWWSSTDIGTGSDTYWGRSMQGRFMGVYKTNNYYAKTLGLSVRCVKD